MLLMKFVMAKCLFVSLSNITQNGKLGTPNSKLDLVCCSGAIFDDDIKRYLAITNSISSVIERYDINYMFLCY